MSGILTTAGVATSSVWMQQDPHLWVGRDDEGCIGTIERGRAFRYVDPDGASRCSHRSLAEAQQAHSLANQQCGADPRASSSALLVLAALAAAIMTAAFVATAMVVL